MTPFELVGVLVSAALHAAWSVPIKGSRDPLAFNLFQTGPDLAAAAALPWRFLLAALPTASYGPIVHALRSAPVSSVVAVRQSSVLFAMAFGFVSLGERPTRLRIAGALATVTGVVLVSR